MQFKREAIPMASKCKRCFTLLMIKNVDTNIIKISAFTKSLARILSSVATSPDEDVRKPKSHRDPWRSMTSIPLSRRTLCQYLSEFSMYTTVT